MSNDRHSISIDRVHAGETDALINLYIDLFHDREPLTKFIGLSREQMVSIAHAKYAGPEAKALTLGLCWIARDHAYANRMAGFVVCDDPAVVGEHGMPENLTEQESSKIAAVMALLNDIRSPVKERIAEGPGKCMHVAAIGVAPGYEGKGIAKRLLQQALSGARDQGFISSFSECTSMASRMLHERYGFRNLKSVSVSGFEVDGRRPFAGADLDIHLMWKSFEDGEQF